MRGGRARTELSGGAPRSFMNGPRRLSHIWKRRAVASQSSLSVPIYTRVCICWLILLSCLYSPPDLILGARTSPFRARDLAFLLFTSDVVFCDVDLRRTTALPPTLRLSFSLHTCIKIPLSFSLSLSLAFFLSVCTRERSITIRFASTSQWTTWFQ